MTPAELTERTIRKLLADLAPDLESLERIATEIRDAGGPLGDPKLDAAARAFLAVQLHNYYSAVEKMLERIVRTLDGVVPAGEAWHRELLEQVSRPAPNIRPALLEPEVAGELDRLRSFRHFFRNAYTVELCWKELEVHRKRVEALQPALRSNLSRIVEHLEATLATIENAGQA